MDFAKPVFFKKNCLIGLFFVAVVLVFENCNPFDGADCPKLIGVAKVGGYKIEKVPTSTASPFRLQFLDSITGYGIRNSLSLVRTIDGGQTWLPTAFSQILFSAYHFFSRDTGIVVQFVFDQVDFQQKMIFLKTTDGGLTRQSMADTLYGIATSIYFLDEKTGWMVGSLGVLDPNSGQAIYNYGLFSTKNGGQTWTKTTQFQPISTQQPMFWVNNKVGYCLSEQARLFRTTDGGENWDEKPSQSFLSFFPSLRFLDEKFGYAFFNNQFGFGPMNQVFYTLDGGENWQSLNGPAEFVAILDFDKKLRALIAAKSSKCGEPFSTGFFANLSGSVDFDETNPLTNVFSWEPIHFGDPKQFFVNLNGSQLLKVTRE